MDMLNIFRYYHEIGRVNDAKAATSDKSEPSKQKKVVTLYDWYIQLKESRRCTLLQNSSFCIRGYKKLGSCDKEDYWTTSEITEFSGPRSMGTRNTIYFLSGNMDAKSSLLAGFSESFNHYFNDGFPENWKSILEVFADQILKKGASVDQINEQLRQKSMINNMPRPNFSTRRRLSAAERAEQGLHEMIRKDYAQYTRELKRKSNASKAGETKAKRKSLDDTAKPKFDIESDAEDECEFEPINENWTNEDVEKLWCAISEINPCSDSDWDQVMMLFDQERPLDEVKRQAKPMCDKMRPKNTPETDLIKRLRQIAPKDKSLPTKGTISRKNLEDVLRKAIFYNRHKDDSGLHDMDLDSDDEFISEMLVNTSIRTNKKTPDCYKMKGIECELLVDSCRRQNDTSFTVGHDFSTPIRNPHKKYSVKYCAHQVNGKLGRQQQKFDKDELSDDSDFEHDLAEEENEEEEGIEDEQPNSLLINA